MRAADSGTDRAQLADTKTFFQTVADVVTGAGLGLFGLLGDRFEQIVGFAVENVAKCGEQLDVDPLRWCGDQFVDVLAGQVQPAVRPAAGPVRWSGRCPGWPSPAADATASSSAKSSPITFVLCLVALCVVSLCVVALCLVVG